MEVAAAAAAGLTVELLAAAIPVAGAMPVQQVRLGVVGFWQLCWQCCTAVVPQLVLPRMLHTNSAAHF